MEELKEYWKKLCEQPGSLNAFHYLLFLTIGECIFFYIRPINNALGVSDYTDNIFMAFWLIGIYYALPTFLQSVRLVDIVLYLAIAAFYYYSPIIYPQTEYFVHDTFDWFAFHTIPFYFLGIAIDFQRDKSSLLYISRFQILATGLFTFLSLLGMVNSATDFHDQMYRSYSVLFPTMFSFYYYIKNNKNKIDFLFFIFGLMQIMMYGTRGPLVCIMIFLFLFLFQNFRHSTVVIINLLLIVGVFYIFLRPIMLVLMFVSRSVGLSTRIFESYLDDELVNYEKSSGRNDIHEVLWSNITNDSGGIGYGLGSDRYLGLHQGEYAHNLVYEIWMDFGLYIGSVVLILLLLLMIASFRKAYKTESFFLFLMLFVWGIVRQMISGSYIQDFQLFLFLGFCVSLLRSDNLNQPEEKITFIIDNSCHSE